MGKILFIAEKPSVAAEFAKALKTGGRKRDGYIEDEKYIVTWCVGHLVTMSYPEDYDTALKKWSLGTIPFIPQNFKYQVISQVKKQFDTVSSLLNRADVEKIYVCTDSGREGEYIYRLVDMMANVGDKPKFRVWIDSQTEEEILRGIREALPLSQYDALSASAFLRAKEDYLMGINFSRVLSLKYGPIVAAASHRDFAVISAGRVMTCVLGMVVRREREIRDFVKTSFYKVSAGLNMPCGEKSRAEKDDNDEKPEKTTLPEKKVELSADISCESEDISRNPLFEAEWKVCKTSRYYESPKLYKENGFKAREDAEALIGALTKPDLESNTADGGIHDRGANRINSAVIKSLTSKKELKNPPLLYNLAELQNDCSKLFKINPDETLKIAQELYEKKMTTYPRTDARVLSTAVAKEIGKNISGLVNFEKLSSFADEIYRNKMYNKIAKSKYVNDKQITDHYAVIPTGQGLNSLRGLSPLSQKVYELICRRFLSIFYPAAEYKKLSIVLETDGEAFSAGFKALEKEGYLKVAASANAGTSGKNRTPKETSGKDTAGKNAEKATDTDIDNEVSAGDVAGVLSKLKKGDILDITGFEIKEGETSPPKRYTSGSMILAMENAGQLIEDEELREQIKGSGIGTSATRAEILKKLFNIKYLKLNEKTQVIYPTMFGEMVNDVVAASIKPLLNPELTASWEKGLAYVAEGSITPEEYMEKLVKFVAGKTNAVKNIHNEYQMRQYLMRIPQYYRTAKDDKKKTQKTGDDGYEEIGT